MLPLVIRFRILKFEQNPLRIEWAISSLVQLYKVWRRTYIHTDKSESWNGTFKSIQRFFIIQAIHYLTSTLLIIKLAILFVIVGLPHGTHFWSSMSKSHTQFFEAPLFHKGASYISKYLHSPRNFNNIPRKLIHILRIWHQYSPKFVSHILHFQVK